MGYYCNQEAVREGHQHPEINHSARFESSKDGFVQGIWHGRAGNHPSGRNPRSVLDVPTAPYKGAHYATFPPNLIAPLIRASCPRRSCPECGQAWAPVVEKTNIPTRGNSTIGPGYKELTEMGQSNRGQGEYSPGIIDSKILDYRPTCSHNHDPIPGIVLDPFIGSGTTGAVARELQRRWIGLDISMDYIDQQAKVRALKWTPSNALNQLPLFKRETADD